MIKLYDFDRSGNCHKVRMLLSFLGIDYQRVPIDLVKKEQMEADFLALNPLHKVPVLDDAGYIVRDSAAILIYLSRKYGNSDWYPENAEDMAEVQQWLSFSVNEVFNGLAIARAIIIFNRDADLEVPRQIAAEALKLMEQRLKEHDWLALNRFTIADIACYPYTALIHEGHMSLEDYPAIRAWFKRIESLPDYASMQGLPYPA